MQSVDSDGKQLACGGCGQASSISSSQQVPRSGQWTLRHQGTINYAFTIELQTNLRENFTITEKAPSGVNQRKVYMKLGCRCKGC